jgi:hypothetical protein
VGAGKRTTPDHGLRRAAAKSLLKKRWHPAVAPDALRVMMEALAVDRGRRRHRRL